MGYRAILFYFLALLVQNIVAFPPGVLEYLTQAHHEGKLDARADSPYTKRQAPGVIPPFDPEVQYVSNQGAHAFNPPSGNDQRGPCTYLIIVASHPSHPVLGPGLNAMANHGYLDHTGVGSIQDFITGTQQAFGMGKPPCSLTSSAPLLSLWI